VNDDLYICGMNEDRELCLGSRKNVNDAHYLMNKKVKLFQNSSKIINVVKKLKQIFFNFFLFDFFFFFNF
jgi:hypothetical protein